jgi:uncharacterized membrane protein YkvA (DUF1232 family)
MAMTDRHSTRDPFGGSGPAERLRGLRGRAADLRGRYLPDLSTRAVWIAAAAAVYVLVPCDLVPDVIPLAGIVDDVAVGLAAWQSIAADIRRCRQKRIGRDMAMNR